MSEPQHQNSFCFSRDGGQRNGKGYKHSSPSFPPAMTPLELAAINRKFKLVKMLLARGDVIEFPHALECKYNFANINHHLIMTCELSGQNLSTVSVLLVHHFR